MSTIPLQRSRLTSGFFLLVTLLLSVSCTSAGEKRFTLLPASHTGIDFENRVEDTPEFSILNYLYFYDGGGVTAGDVDNNGLPDLFFTGNDVENRLYLNKGNFEFDDITGQAGVGGDPGSWSTGAVMADVNGDGYLDIYVSRVNYLNKSGPNQLFINNGNGTFTESAAEYGLDFSGYSTQAVFFDYNIDGRLDLFLLNHSFHSDRTYGEAGILRAMQDPNAGDRLFRNDDGRFTDVTEEAGIYSSALGYGLGVAVSDINMDGLPDIYVGNDFHEDDYLYINNGDGTFTEALYTSLGHTSSASMGNDIADINNDGYAEIISMDMMPEDHETFMQSGGPDLYAVYETKKEFGFGEKNARNTLQLHRGFDRDGTPLFSDIAFLSGTAQTDWSWAPLIMDLNNNGLADLFVTNGIARRPNDLDFVRAMNYSREQNSEGAPELQGDRVTEEEMDLLRYMPQRTISNRAFQNNGDLTFVDKSVEWGLDTPSFSGGAVYADLNNDGRLDLVVNNINMPPFIYRNNTPVDDFSNFLKVKLSGNGMNRTGIGAKVFLYVEDRLFYREQMPVRGFQSSVDHVLHFGLGETTGLDSLLVIWPDGSRQKMQDVEANRLVEIHQQEADGTFDYSRLHRNREESRIEDVTDEVQLAYRHDENEFNDFSQEPLMPWKLSTQGPALAVADVTGDGLDDLFIGGARWQAGKLFLQQPDGRFVLSNEELFETDRASEDVDALFFDATGDGLLDLYVVSGGGELTGLDNALRDRLYINEGDGRFSKSAGRLPEIYLNGSVVRAADFDGDGHTDLFVGSRAIPWRYGDVPPSFLLKNDGAGHFFDVTDDVAPSLKEIGLVTDARWADLSGTGRPDLLIAGEWMPVQLFRNTGSSLELKTDEAGFGAASGLWQSLLVDDLNGNGLPDIIAGNIGRNSKLKATEKSPLRLYIGDFEGSGQMAPIIATQIDGDYRPFEQLDELLTQLPFLTNQVRSYRDFASRTITGLFGRDTVGAARILEVTQLGSVAWYNNGDGTFRMEELPPEAQFSPVMAINTIDPAGSSERIGEQGENGEVTALSGGEPAVRDILLGGNLYDVKPALGGRQDAFYGVHLTSDEPRGSWRALSLQSSGFIVRGDVREIKEVRRNDDRLLLVARNNDTLQIFKLPM